MTRHQASITIIILCPHSIAAVLLDEPASHAPASPPLPLVAAGNGVGAVAEQFTKTGAGGRHD
ncbi:MAG: hypothetical protein IPM39_29395 [Chloroflexi bacterium]|nr:hypothetical protein [Chloroflexota bacterium]